MIYTKETGLPKDFSIGLHSIVYDATSGFGDYDHLLEKYENTLFIFNDNIQDHNFFFPGTGNAVARKYNKFNPNKFTRSAGISTGYSTISGRFQCLDDTVLPFINHDLSEVNELLKTGNYKTVIYCSKIDGTFGTGLFHVDQTVLDYILSELQNMCNVFLK